MPRKASFGRRRNRAASSQSRWTKNQFRRTFETLETRAMLSANDLLVTDLDNAAVLRYNERAGTPAFGGVPTNNPFAEYSGVATAQNGSYYVASLGTGSVLHYSNSGTLLDSIVDPTTAPGTLTFGPNGNLYLGDLAGAVYQIDPTTDTIISADTFYIAGSVGGLAFLHNGDLLVGNLSDGSVGEYTGTTFDFNVIGAGTIVDGAGMNDSGSVSGYMQPGAIIVEQNGDLLIADFNFDYSNGHHQIVQATPTTPGNPYSTSTFIDFSSFGAVPGSGGLYNQPEAMLVDADGNLLIGLSPDHSDHGSIQKFNITTGAYMSTIASGIGTPTGLAYVPSVNSDLLISDLDNADVARYNYPGGGAVPGGVPTNNPFAEYSGVATAPDGSYYVASLGIGAVLHYSGNGTLLDSIADPTTAPGTLTFGPNGNLYLGDLAGAVYQIDPITDTIISADTFYIAGSVGGLAFLHNGDLLVGNLSDGSVGEYTGTTFDFNVIGAGTVVDGAGMNDSGSVSGYMQPGAIIVEQNGDLLIADFNFDYSNGHHQIVQATPTTPGNPYSTSTFIDFSSFGAVPGSGGLYNQPEAMLVDQQGELVIGLSPDHSEHGSVQTFNLTTGAYIGTVESGMGTPTGLALIQTAPVVNLSGGATGYTAGAAGVAVDSGLSLSDTNQLPSLSAAVTINSPLSGDTLNFTNQNGITGSFSGGTLTLTGSATLAQYQTALRSVTFSNATNTSTASRTISFTVTDSLASSVIATKTVNVFAPVTVSGLYVAGSGTSWSSGMRTAIQNSGLGVSNLGFALQTGANQAKVLPWVNVNVIEAVFSGPVTASIGSLILSGGTAGSTPSVTGFSSLGNNTYSWTLSGPLTKNRLEISFLASGGNAVVDSRGAGIDGEWTNGTSTFTSSNGNGLSGGNFNFLFNALPGDAARNGSVVNLTDYGNVRAQLNKVSTSSLYSPYLDVQGFGVINLTDYGAVRSRLNQTLPAALTAPAPQSGDVGGLVTDDELAGLALAAVEGTGGGSASHATDNAVSQFDLADLWA